LDLLRMERLSANLLLCLFAGAAEVFEIHQRPEALHFGFDRTDDSPPKLYKELRDAAGNEGKSRVGTGGAWLDPASGVVRVSALADAIYNNLDDKTRKQLKVPPMTSAQLALEMVEGVEKVSFLMGAAGT
jgi:hypothetical protein